METAPAIVTWLRTLLRVSFAALFVYASLGKVANPADFAAELANYRLIPPPVTGWLALYLPWLELSCAAGLISRALRRGAWLLAVGLCAGFAFFVTSAWLRGLDISCGCFGGSSSGTIDGLTVSRTLGLLGLAVWGCLSETRSAPVAPSSAPHRVPTD